MSAHETPAAIDRFLAALGDIPVLTDPVLVRRKSRDFFWYSPVLKRQLDGVTAACVVRPRDEAELLLVAATACRFGVPLTARGGGTGNYGQAMPLNGGAVVDMTGFDQLLHVENGVARVEAGMNMLLLDRALRAQGLEIRMYPSTKRTATIGGFICGGSGGIGSVRWGGLRDSGNLLGARVVTLEDPPRAVELRGAETVAINHAYGTTALVCALDIPVQPAVPWRELCWSFAEFGAAAEFGLALAASPALEIKLSTVTDAGLTPYFASLRDRAPPDRPLAIALVAPAALAPALALAIRHGGTLVHEDDLAAVEDDPSRVPLYELTWNHTTLQVLKRDRSATYLQCLYPADGALERVERMRARFGDELMMHLEFMPGAGGRMGCAALPVIRFTDEARLAEIIQLHEAEGVLIANPHVYTIEEGGPHRVASPDLAGAKARFDPLGLLNPGKMRDAPTPLPMPVPQPGLATA